MAEEPRGPESLSKELSALRQESEERFRRLIGALTDYIYTVRVENGRAVETYHGPGCEAITGYASGEFAADPYLWYRMVVEEDRPLVEERIRRLLDGEACEPFEHRIVRKDGAVRWIQNTPVTHRDAEGRILGYDGLIRDVTDRAQATAALKKSEERFRALFEGIHDAVVVHTLGTKDRPAPIVEVNDAACRLVGYARTELIGMSLLGFWARDDGVEPQAILDQLTASKSAAYDAVMIHRDGRRIPVDIHTRLFAFEGRPSLISVVRDITERKRMEEALRVSEAALKRSQEVAHVGHWIWDVRRNTVACSDEVYRIFGIAPEPKGAPLDFSHIFAGLIHPEDASRVYATSRTALEIRRPIATEFRVVWPDGSEHHIWTVPGDMVTDDKGDVIQFSGIVQDITERKQAEERLRQREDRFRAIVETTQEWIWSIDMAGRHTYSNLGLTNILGYSPDEILGREIRDFLHPDERQAVETMLRDKAVTREGWSGIVLRWLHKDGGYRYLESNAVPILDPEGNLIGYQGADRDITERKHDEELLRTELDLLAAANEKRGLNELLELCLTSAIRMSALDSGGIYVRRESGGLVLACHRGLSDAFVAAVRYGTRDSANYRILEEGRPVYQRFADLDVRKDEPQHAEGLRAIAVLPLLHRGQIIGCMNVASHAHDEVSPRARIALEGIAALAGGIIARAETEQALEQSEERLNRIVETSPIGIVIIDCDGVIVFANPATERILGLSRSGIVGRRYDAPSWKITAPNGGPFPDEELPFVRVMRNGAPVAGAEHAVVRPDGRRVILSINAAPLKDEHGSVTAAVASLDDVSERRHAEQALRQSEERYRAMVENMGSGVSVYEVVNDGEDFIIKDINPAAERISKVQKERIIGRSLLGLFPNMDRFGLFAALQKVHRTGEPMHLPPMFYKDGLHEGWREAFLYRLPTGEIVAIYDDVTERKEAERALRDSEARLSSIFRAAPVGIGLVRDRVLAQVNERICEMVGRSADELIGQSARVMYPTQDDYDYVGREKYRQIAERGTGSVETHWIHKDGSILDVILSSTPLDPEDLLSGVTFTAVDITARKKAERALRQERDRAQAYLEIAGVMFIVLDADGCVSLINRRGCEILGYDAKEIVGKNWFDHFVPERLQKTVRGVFERLLSGEIQPVEYQEHPVLTWSGEERIVAWHNTALRDANGRIIAALSSGEDVTERRRLEQEKVLFEAHLRQQQKLESIGTLAAGVAHEINNPINGIMNYAQLIANRLRDDESSRRYATRIVEETERVSEIVRDLLAFSRHDQQTHGAARMHEIVATTVSLVRALLRRDRIALEIEVAEDLPQVKCRSQQIQQVLLNLITNSHDALVERFTGDHPDKRIRVTARRVESKGKHWIRTSVEDHGAGIPPEIGERVFDPFFTTKPRDKGTGLGLSVSYGIVKDHGGALWFESEVGRGTRFHLDLPLDEERDVGGGLADAPAS